MIAATPEVPASTGGRLDVPTGAALTIGAVLGTGVISLPGDDDVWALGDRGVRCYLWLDGSALTGTLKGKGTAGLPIQYK